MFLYTNVHSSIKVELKCSHKVELKCLLTDEWINRMQYIHAMKCYLAKNEMKHRYVPQDGWTSETYVKWKKQVTEDCMLYDSINMKYP